MEHPSFTVLHRSFLPNSCLGDFLPFSFFMSLFGSFLFSPIILEPCYSVLKMQNREERLHNLTFKPLRFSVLLPLHEFFLVFLPTLWERWDTWREKPLPQCSGVKHLLCRRPRVPLEHYTLPEQGEKPFLDL